MSREKKVIGVGGGIGSGKTTVSKVFTDCGARYISADEIGWDVLDDIKEELMQEFGNEIMQHNDIDREKLRTCVFADIQHLQRLNALSHPLLKERLLQRIDAVTQGMVVVDAALLFEWPEILRRIDFPILVTADDIHKEHRARNKGIDEVTFRRIRHMQKPDEDIIPHARYVITNNGTLEDLRIQCRTIYEEIADDC
jgi:dephospho-CoA kinase